MKVLAILQCQWFTPQTVVKVREIMARAPTPEHRARLAAFFLFRSCYTGRMLRSVFGEELCQQIIWENASPVIGDKPSACFAADPVHLQGLLNHFTPKVVLAFGMVASEALRPLCKPDRLIIGPHPAARTANRTVHLRRMREELYAKTAQLSARSHI